MNSYIFMKQLTKNIENELSNLLIEKHLYNFIRDFLYSSTKILFDTSYKYDNLTFEIPIKGSNYMILFDETQLKQNETYPNVFIETNKSMGQQYRHIFEIIGDFSSYEYNNYTYKNYTNMYGYFFVKLKIIDYGTNPELQKYSDDYVWCRYIVGIGKLT